MNFNLENLIRDNIKKMTAYSSARDEFNGPASVFLDANENSYGSPLSENYHRYPDPMQWKVKEKLSELKGIPLQNIFLGNGSDEAIDLLFRIFCEPAKDNVIICPPTYGMYKVCAELNDIETKEVNLTTEFQLDLVAIEKAINSFTKIIFICSPNNPSGNTIRRNDIETVLTNFSGIVVIDEAYIDYSENKSFINNLSAYANLVVLQTLSKAWGLAGLRLGMAFSSPFIIELLNKIKYPYNINTSSQLLILEALQNKNWVTEQCNKILFQKEFLRMELLKLPIVENVYPSDTNFLLVKMKQARNIYEFLISREIIVRDRSKFILCENCLRITIGTEYENKILIEELKSYKQ